MTALIAFVSGLVFGLGLIVSGMANPAKVLGFLDLAGQWDPSLAFVMGGAVLITAAGFAVLRRRRASLTGEPLRWPTATRIDLRLALGSLAFGAGWGLAGFCPGPALVAAAAGVPQALIFVAAMLAGMAIYAALEALRSR
ncbi:MULTISPECIES: YeeE/YedE family protein [Achromobacter]|uniref:YeeE/YedE family protein n=1 Tax=Achromobacter spanius TaxID=217203 RepID=A0ABY8GNB2_9BURK|nr:MULTISPECIES: YeeE/YedE family protein [Achromobacter]WAI84437.1 YeeE/YedE family protein [Achromobacter spanius]WEX94520.1 YeeE/YedE family protein [Achromobacter sp. SS2-2022]WFP06314.1 YeeE/YedE family protein [Achromobacter spanius]